MELEGKIRNLTILRERCRQRQRRGKVISELTTKSARLPVFKLRRPKHYLRRKMPRDTRSKLKDRLKRRS